MPKLASTPRAYLIGGDGFHKVFWPSLALAFCMTHPSHTAFGPMATIQAFWRDAYEFLLDRMMRGSHQMMWWSLFGLLSSSCCAVQLILNLFNFGCAGFNTYLGPLRPGFLAVTITLNLRMWELALPNIGLPSTPDYFLPSVVASTVMAIFLSILPELTELRNRRKVSDSNLMEAASGTSYLEAVLSLEGLGCVACINSVLGAVESVAKEKVVAKTVSLEEKEAKFKLSCDEVEARDSIVPALINQIQAVGFEATLQSIGKSTASSTAKVSDDQDTSAGGGTLSAIAAGLASSSCCLLQLGVNLLATLNVAHIGCAGFNKFLGPWRLHIRTLTFCWLGYSWFQNFRSDKGECCKPKRHRLLFNTALCLALTFLPELLRLSGGNAIAPPTVGAKVLKLTVDGMGCEACEAHVRGVMERSSGVISGHADFKKGFAEVEVADDWGFDLEKVLQNLKLDGYEAKLAKP